MGIRRPLLARLDGIACFATTKTALAVTARVAVTR